MELFRKAKGIQTRWAGPENLKAEKGRGGMANRGGKGHYAEFIKAGGEVSLLDIQGSGTVRRIFLTLRNFGPMALRSMVIEMYWDGAATPAVCAPLGDFFCVGLGRCTPFESELFASPEGRSLVCYVPMPFRRLAKIVLRNESTEDTAVYFDVDLTLGEEHDDDVLYFHAHWRRERRGDLDKDFVVLPKVTGAGRFVGTNMSVLSDPAWKAEWWGEGEPKIYLDGDQKWPTLVGTGTEDYVSSAWGMGHFAGRYSGCTVTDLEHGQFAFYRLHVPDPVYFDKDCRVEIQRMGGARKEKLLALKQAGAECKLAAVIEVFKVTKVLEMDPPPAAENERFPMTAWCNVFRRDDFAATAYFYLDSPENGLGPIAPLEDRMAGVLSKEQISGAGL